MLYVVKPHQASKKAYRNDPEKFKDAQGKLMRMVQTDLKRLLKIVTMLIRKRKRRLQRNVIMQILKQKGKLRKRHTKKIQKSVKKVFNTIRMSAEKKYVVKKGMNIHCLNPMKHLLSFMLKAFFMNLCVILK